MQSTREYEHGGNEMLDYVNPERYLDTDKFSGYEIKESHYKEPNGSGHANKYVLTKDDKEITIINSWGSLGFMNGGWEIIVTDWITFANVSEEEVYRLIKEVI